MKKYTFSKYGEVMYAINDAGAKFLERHRWLYYLLNFTWGSIMTIVGLLVALVLIIIGFKPQSYHGIWYFKVAKSWGGLSLGIIFLRDSNSGDYINPHELGHTYQNAILGPFALLLSFIPSFIRYWYYTLRSKKGLTNKPYDGIWFENSASNIGYQIMTKAV